MINGTSEHRINSSSDPNPDFGSVSELLFSPAISQFMPFVVVSQVVINETPVEAW